MARVGFLKFVSHHIILLPQCPRIYRISENNLRLNSKRCDNIISRASMFA
jgi:hypothetical protein